MFSIKSFVAFVAGVRKGRERGFWARAGSARGSLAVSRPNSLPSPFPVGGGGGVLPYKRLIGMYRWMGSHFHDWSDYNGVALACVASFSSRGSSRKLGQEQKKKNDGVISTFFLFPL